MKKRQGYFSWLLNKLKNNFIGFFRDNKESVIPAIFCIIIAVIFSICLIQNNIGDFYNTEINAKIENELQEYLAGDKNAFALDATVEVSDENLKISPFYYFDKTFFPQHLTYTFADKSYTWNISSSNAVIFYIFSIAIACIFAYVLFKLICGFIDHLYDYNDYHSRRVKKLLTIDILKFIGIIILGFILIPIQPKNVSEEYMKKVETEVQDYLEEKNENFENDYYILTDSVGTIVVSGIRTSKNTDENSNKFFSDAPNNIIEHLINYVPKIYVYNKDLNSGIWTNNGRIEILILGLSIIVLFYLLTIAFIAMLTCIIVMSISTIVQVIRNSIKEYKKSIDKIDNRDKFYYEEYTDYIYNDEDEGNEDEIYDEETNNVEEQNKE